MTSGAQDSLLGYPVEFCEDLVDLAAGSYSVVFGAFSLGYVCVSKIGIRYIVDNLTDKPNLLWYAYTREGGGVANTEAIKVLKTAVS